MYKLKALTDRFETKNVSIIDAAILINSTVKSLEGINSDTGAMKKLN